MSPSRSTYKSLSTILIAQNGLNDSGGEKLTSIIQHHWPLTFISMINITFESLIARKVLIFQHVCFNELLKFHALLC